MAWLTCEPCRRLRVLGSPLATVTLRILRHGTASSFSMGRAGAVVRRGHEVIHFNDNDLALRYLASSAVQVEDAIARLHKAALSVLEGKLGKKFMGVAAAAAALRKEFVFSEKDKVFGKRLRALHDAFAFTRHLTELGEECWLRELTQALDRCKPTDIAADSGRLSARASGDNSVAVDMETVTGGKKKRKKKAKASKAVLAAVDYGALELDSSVRTVVDDLEDEWADHVGDGVTAQGPSGSSSGTTRKLQQQTSRERSPRGAREKELLSHVVGDRVVIHGLVSRPDLAGLLGTVCSIDLVSRRCGVRLASGTNEKLLIKPENLKKSIFK